MYFLTASAAMMPALRVSFSAAWRKVVLNCVSAFVALFQSPVSPLTIPLPSYLARDADFERQEYIS
jgi:hypothetical protein